MGRKSQLINIDKLTLTNRETSYCCIVATSRLPPEQILKVVREELEYISQEGRDMIYLLLGYEDKIVNKRLMKEDCAFRDYLVEWRDGLPKKNR